MASNSVELSTLDAETHVPRNEISSHTGWEAIIASEARNERGVLSESYTDRAALMSSSSTMTTSILPITRKGSDAAGGEIRQKTRQQKSMTSQGLMQLPTSHQPSRAAVFQSLFLTHFIEFYRNSKTDTKRISWVHQVPQFVANSPSLAVKYCIRATSMAIYGQLTDDKSIQSDSRRWCTFGSEQYPADDRSGGDRYKRRRRSNPVAKDDDVSLIFATLLFIHFEICMPTRQQQRI